MNQLSTIQQSRYDSRDYSFVAAGGNLPAAIDLKPSVYEVEDQGGISSCACNSVISACEMFRNADYSRLFPYYNSRLSSGRMGLEGVELRAVFAALSVSGTVLETEYPYDVSKVDVHPPSNFYGDAATVNLYKVTEYQKIFNCTHGGDLPADRSDQIKAALNSGLPVVIGTSIRQDIFALTGPWQTHKLSTTSPYGYSHALLIIGYDDTVGRWLVQNSWGTGYADGGFFGYPYDVFLQDCFEAWVITEFAGCRAKQNYTASRSKVYLASGGDTFTAANSGLQIFGGSGNDAVKILSNVNDLTLDANIEHIELSSVRESYKLESTPQGLQVRSGATTVATLGSLNQPTTFVFADGSVVVNQTGATTFSIT